MTDCNYVLLPQETASALYAHAVYSEFNNRRARLKLSKPIHEIFPPASPLISALFGVIHHQTKLLSVSLQSVR